MGCTTAANDGPPEKPESIALRAASPLVFEIPPELSLLYAYIRELRSPDPGAAASWLGLRFVCWYDFRHGLYGIFKRDNCRAITQCKAMSAARPASHHTVHSEFLRAAETNDCVAGQQ